MVPFLPHALLFFTKSYYIIAMETCKDSFLPFYPTHDNIPSSLSSSGAWVSNQEANCEPTAHRLFLTDNASLTFEP